MQMSHEDEEFMNRTLEVINQHLSDESFNVEAMASALCMSRSSLLRKIKTLFDMPPLDFIRLIRLKKAADLIQEAVTAMNAKMPVNRMAQAIHGHPTLSEVVLAAAKQF